MPARLSLLSTVVRLLGVLAMLGIVATHGVLVPGAAHDGTTAAGTSTGASCPMTDHGPSAAPMDCPGAAAPTAAGDVSPAAPLVSHLLPPAALPQWPSVRSATSAPPAAAPTHVILRT